VYELFYFPGNANLAPHFVLEEIGAPFELTLVDRDRDAQRSPEYMKLNPNGRIPTLVDHGAKDLVVYETAAIIAYLADTHPEAKLAPPVGTNERAHYYQWMFHLSNTVQAQAHLFFYPEQHVGDLAAKDAMFAKAQDDWGAMFRVVDAQLEGRAYLLGDSLSAADLYLAMLTRWGRNMKTPTRTMPNLRRHAESMFARPAVLRALATEGIKAPYF
jgi:glutathione S-transferase